MYEFIYENIGSVKEKNRKTFNNMRLSILKYDELNLLVVKNKNRKMFKTLKERDRKFFDDLMENLIEKEKMEGLDIDAFLQAYSPALLFVYTNEVLRKEARFFESLVAIGSESNNRYVFNGSKAIKNQNRNINNWNTQTEEIAVDLEREIWIKTHKKRGYKKIMWITSEDEKVCEKCGVLDGKIFDIDKVPSRPHIHCRCRLQVIEQTE